MRLKLLAILTLWGAALAAPLPSAAAPGDLDPTFGTGGRVVFQVGLSGYAVDMAAQPDGRIVLVGPSAGSRVALARLLPSGKLDPTFGTGGEARLQLPGEAAPGAVAVRPDGKVVVAGVFFLPGSTYEVFVARLTARGRLDRSFSGNGWAPVPFASPGFGGVRIALLPGGRTLVSGASGPDFAVARLRANGTPDTTFDDDGIRTVSMGAGFDVPCAVLAQPDGKVLLAGEVDNGTSTNFGIARLLEGGDTDTGFGLNGKRITSFTADHDIPRSAALQPDGNVVVVGVAGGADPAFALVRYTSAGAPDPTFGPGGKITTNVGPGFDQAVDVRVGADGRIVVVGTAGTPETFRLAVARYEPNGHLDRSFAGDGTTTIKFRPPDASGQAVALLPGDRIVVAGFAGAGEGSGRFAIARFLGSYPAISVGNARRVEGDGGTATLRVPVRLSVPPGTSDVSVRYATFDGSAVAPGDFRDRTGALSFAGARTFRWIQVPVVGDLRDERNETLRVALSSPVRSTLADAWGTATIRDDD